MHIISHDYSPALLTHETFRYIERNGSDRFCEGDILNEHLLSVCINGIPAMKLICLDTCLPELVTGRLLSEGIISDYQDVAEIKISPDKTRADVLLSSVSDTASDIPADTGKAPYVETIPSSCCGSRTLNGQFSLHRELHPVTPVFWDPQWIFRLADAFSQGTPIHEKTRSAHSAFLAVRDQLLFQCEDIGRHNAVDKTIGYALRNEIDLSSCILFSSGRIPTDMITKIIRAGIPVLASKAAPTEDAVRLAREYRLTLICAARSDRMMVYSDFSTAGA